MTTFTAEHTPAEIVKQFPKASDLFKQARIDFCCNGNKPLRDSFINGDLNEETVLSELNDAYNSWAKENNTVIAWDSMSKSALIDHIVYTHHAYLNDELVPLGEFVTKILRVHGANHPHLKELHQLYHAFKVEMEGHMIQEEQEVFPLIKDYEKAPSEDLRQHIIKANGGLEDDHDKAGTILKRMREITNGFEPPVDACSSYRITYARLSDMESDTFQHVHLENNVLFKNL